MKDLLKTATIFLVLAASMTSCHDRTTELISYEANVPVYMPFNEFRSSFEKSEPIDISHPGKIYFKDEYLFVNEYGKGIHVIDNSNPSEPEKIAFYEILGNVDMAIRGNILFADSYVDLLSIDISDVNNPVEISRLKNVFPEIVPEGDMWFPYAMVDNSKGVIVGWTVKTITEEIDDNGYGGMIYKGQLDFMVKAETNGNWTGGSRGGRLNGPIHAE